MIMIVPAGSQDKGIKLRPVDLGFIPCFCLHFDFSFLEKWNDKLVIFGDRWLDRAGNERNLFSHVV